MAQAKFIWSEPQSLSPSFPAPTMANRSGEYVSNSTFVDGNASFMVYDQGVKEQSQRARFVYGYNTQQVELRIYVNSEIVITAAEGFVVTSVQFEGPEVGGEYLASYHENDSWQGSTWVAPSESNLNQVTMLALSRVEITSTVVTMMPTAGVADIIVDNELMPVTWYTISGCRLPAEPVAPGVYLQCQGSNIKKVLR